VRRDEEATRLQAAKQQRQQQMFAEAARVGLYPIVTFQYSSTTLY
jgi:hypothetical protein